ncbi:MAG: tryptophan--tRNA ligase [Patescibacteria group bacterium]|nr:tryptophan--tRNA ligase [Patescibacteria group bacterium]
MNTKQRIFSAIQPSGELHIGNYLGALKNFVELQDKYDCFFFIADYHSISGEYDPQKKKKQIMDLTLNFLAIGLDPEKCTITVQSQVPEHTELTWIFNTITPISELQRMTQFKDKSQDQEKNINMGLFDYPVLQAADILMYKAYGVPVGQDQIQHIELTRKIARFFNNKFGKTFPEPKDIITETPKIMSLIDPTKKMSKSHGPKSYVGINDEPEIIKQKMKKAVTDIGTTGKMTPATENLFLLLKILGKPEHYKEFLVQHKKGIIKYGQLKEALADDIINYFTPFRAKRKELESKPEYVKEVLAIGADHARKIARETMREVKEKIGLVL